MRTESIDRPDESKTSHRRFRAWVLMLLGALCLSLAACQQPAEIVVVDAKSGTELRTLDVSGRVLPLDERSALVYSSRSLARIDLATGDARWQRDLAESTSVFASDASQVGVFDRSRLELSTVDIEGGTIRPAVSLDRARGRGFRQGFLLGDALWGMDYEGGVFVRTTSGECQEVTTSQPDLEMLALSDKVFVLGKDSYLRAFDARSAQPEWQLQCAGGGSMLRAIHGVLGRVLVASRDGVLACVDASTGVRVWQTTLGGRNLRMTFELQLSRVWVVGDGYGLVALDLRDGSIAKRNESKESFRAIDVCGDSVIVRTFDGELRAYDRTTGDQLWKLGRRVASSDRIVLVASGSCAAVL